MESSGGGLDGSGDKSAVTHLLASLPLHIRGNAFDVEVSGTHAVIGR